MKKKVLFFSPYFYPYVSGLTVYPYRYFQNKKNLEITALTFRHNRRLKHEEVIKNMHIIRMDYAFRISKGFISPQSLVHFIKHIRRHDYVMINLPSVEGLPLIMLSKIFGKKSVVFFYCIIDLGESFVQRLLSAIVNAVVYIQLMLADSVIALPGYIEATQFGKKFAHKIETPLPPIKVLPVNKKFFGKLTKEKGSDIWIGYVGRIAREKGLEYLIEACRILSEKHHLVVHIAGPVDTVGESEYHKKILSDFSASGVSYVLHGFLEEENLGALYKSFDVLVLPSVNSTEAFGMVQFEAMLLGTPVVASHLPGVSASITMTGMGELAKPADAQDLARKLELIINNHARYSEKITFARKVLGDRQKA